MTLHEQLRKILGETDVLPEDPAYAILGSGLLQKVRGKISGSYSEHSIRQAFSVLATDPTSPLARVVHGLGYYRRRVVGRDLPHSTRAEVPSAAHDARIETKFVAFFVRRVRSRTRSPVKVGHSATRGIPIDKWKYPDVVVLDRKVNDRNHNGFALDRAALDVQRGSDEKPFLISSFELQLELTPANFRECFFRCVSNSRWAHLAHLVVAAPITDSLLVAELQQHSSSYGVAVSCYPLPGDKLDALPSASAMLEMTDEQFESLATGVTLTSIATCTPRADLDWGRMRNMRAESPEIGRMLDQIVGCLHDPVANFLAR
jgi:hypothetical protein